MARKKQDTLVLFPEVFYSTAKMSDAQFGVLMRAVFAYRFARDVYDGDDLAVDIAFRTAMSQIDRYIEVCEINRGNAGSKDNCESETEASEKQRNVPHNHTHNHNHNHTHNPNHTHDRNPVDVGADEPPTPAKKQARKSFGKFGWVKLTDEEYNRLLNDLGQAEVERCITYVDESAQTTNNKNKWRDWNLVIRKCSRDGWGLNGYKREERPNGKIESKPLWTVGTTV